MTQEINR